MGRAFKKGERSVVTCGLPKVSFACLIWVVITWRRTKTNATMAFTNTADLRPTFLSSLGDLTSSKTCWIYFAVEGNSCSGNNRAKSSIAVSMTDVAGGGDSKS